MIERPPAPPAPPPRRVNGKPCVSHRLAGRDDRNAGKQTRAGSFIESFANVLIGYWVAIGAQSIIFPLFDIHLPVRDHFLIGALFTVVSIVRSYMLRRVFNRIKALHHAH